MFYITHNSWHDGEYWNVVIDTTEEGNLGKEGVPRLRPYSETYDYAKLTDQDKLNVSVNIYEKVTNAQMTHKIIHNFFFCQIIIYVDNN